MEGGRGTFQERSPFPPPNLPLSPPKIFVWVNGVRGGVAACFGGARLPVSRQRGRGKRGKREDWRGEGKPFKKGSPSPLQASPLPLQRFLYGSMACVAAWRLVSEASVSRLCGKRKGKVESGEPGKERRGGREKRQGKKKSEERKRRIRKGREG